MKLNHWIGTLALVLMTLSFGTGDFGAQSTPQAEGTKTEVQKEQAEGPPPKDLQLKEVVGYVIPIGCPHHDPAQEAALCSKECLHPHASFALQARNRELFFLHGMSQEMRSSLVQQAGKPLVVAGDFVWQGKLRTLHPRRFEVASAERTEAAVADDVEWEGMIYFMTFIKPGPQRDTFDEQQAQELGRGHFGHIRKQAAAGKMVLAGPFGENESGKKLSGLYVYEVETLEEAQSLSLEDPSVRAGYFEVETIPWYGPKSLSR